MQGIKLPVGKETLRWHDFNNVDDDPSDTQQIFLWKKIICIFTICYSLQTKYFTRSKIKLSKIDIFYYFEIYYEIFVVKYFCYASYLIGMVCLNNLCTWILQWCWQALHLSVHQTVKHFMFVATDFEVRRASYFAAIYFINKPQ